MRKSRRRYGRAAQFCQTMAAELDLLEACAQGDTDRVSRLIDAGANVNFSHAVNGWFAAGDLLLIFEVAAEKSR